MKNEFKNVSDSVRRLNPHLFAVGEFQPKIAQQKTRGTLERSRHGAHAGGDGTGACKPCFRVSMVRFGKRLFDDDNLRGGFKPLRDAIASRLGLDDADHLRLIEWEYGQVVTTGAKGTMVRIERL